MRKQICSAVALSWLLPFIAHADSFNIERFNLPTRLVNQELFLNQSGEIAGSFDDSAQKAHDFVVQGGHVKIFDTQSSCYEYGGPTDCSYNILGFNNRGQILANGNESGLYSNGAWHSIVGPTGTSAGVVAAGLTNSGSV